MAYSLAATLAVAGVAFGAVVPAAQADTGASLSSLFNNVAITDDTNTNPSNPFLGFDHNGNTFSQQDLNVAGWAPGTQVTVNGARLTMPNVSAGTNDNVVANGQTVAYQASGQALTFLAEATGGTATGGGTLTYSDGSQGTYSATFQDWMAGPTDLMQIILPNENGTSGHAASPGVNTSNNAWISPKLFTVSVPLDPSKTLTSLTLPAQPTTGAIHIFAIGVRNTSAGGWVGAWSAPVDDGATALHPQGETPCVVVAFLGAPTCGDQPWTNRSARMVEHVGIGGSSIRVRLDNAFAAVPSNNNQNWAGVPLTVGHATVAVQAPPAASPNVVSSPQTLTFNGSPNVTIPAGGQVYSDPLTFPVAANTNLDISLYFPGTVNSFSAHHHALETQFSTSDNTGDKTADVNSGTSLWNNTFYSWLLVSGIDVLPTAANHSIVFLGDSESDGISVNPTKCGLWIVCLDSAIFDANTRYPDLVETGFNNSVAILNAGISGDEVGNDIFPGIPGYGHPEVDGPANNSVLCCVASPSDGISMVSRLDRDVLSQAGIKTVVIQGGANDIGAMYAQNGSADPAVVAKAVEDNMTTIIKTAESYKLNVVLQTIDPKLGCGSAWTAGSGEELARDAVNTWIKGKPLLTTFIDTTSALDPNLTNSTLGPVPPATPTYNSGDYCHPNLGGYQAMAARAVAGLAGL